MSVAAARLVDGECSASVPHDEDATDGDFSLGWQVGLLSQPVSQSQGGGEISIRQEPRQIGGRVS